MKGVVNKFQAVASDETNVTYDDENDESGDDGGGAIHDTSTIDALLPTLVHPTEYEAIVNHNNHDSTNQQQLEQHQHQQQQQSQQQTRLISSNKGLLNFCFMSVLFSANHGCVVACLSLATSRLGNEAGATQSSVLYIFYTGSAVLGSTYVVKELGSRNAMTVGMGLYCLYVGAFYIATIHVQYQTIAATIGAMIGGIGAGFLWTAQGSYFAQSAINYSHDVRSTSHAGYLNITTARNTINANTAQSEGTSRLAGIFAFTYLALEVSLRLLSSVLIQVGNVSWSTIFATYSVITILSTILLVFVQDLDESNGNNNTTSTVFTTPGNQQDLVQPYQHQEQQPPSAWYKITAAIQLLRYDPKMKYMIGLNAVFGFAASFLNSYVNGTVVPIALDDPDSKYVGILTAWISCVAATMSLVFGQITAQTSTMKGPILTFGSICFALVAFPFLIWPNIATQWGWYSLLFVYTMHGIGRSTFESTLKATFADYFIYEKEGAFANIIFQNGLASAIGYILTIKLPCHNTASAYCVQYSDGTYHDVFKFETLVVLSAVVAVLGYWRASYLNTRAVINTTE